MHTTKTKIVATLGPASNTPEIINKLIKSGVNVFRLNLSHGDYKQHNNAIRFIRSESKATNTSVAILADLQGPKIRIGLLPQNGVNIKTGTDIILTTEDIIGDEDSISISYIDFAVDVKKDETVLIDDGKVKLSVKKSINNKKVLCKVIVGGILTSRKGVNLPNTNLSLPSLTTKDYRDLEFIFENDIDWIALSFVRKVDDILTLKKLLKNHGSKIRVISKIEKPEALVDIDNIIDASDGIMVARGDLGVELPFHEVPLIQKKLIAKCINLSTPVIIATQMLESMIYNFNPTRAETNDVANAVIDGADALMLSAETSVGKYPVESVKNMHQIISYYESNSYKYHNDNKIDELKDNFIAKSVSLSAQKLAEQTSAKALITFTHSGRTAIQISSFRPRAAIYTFNDNKLLNQQLSLIWGIVAIPFDLHQSSDEFFDKTQDYLVRSNYVKSKDIIIHVGSIPVTDKLSTNTLRITTIP